MCIYIFRDFFLRASVTELFNISLFKPTGTSEPVEMMDVSSPCFLVGL